MNFNKIGYYLIAIVIFLAIADFFSSSYSVRIVGQNILNIRLWVIILYLFVVIARPSLIMTTGMKWLMSYFVVYLLLEMFGHYDLWGFGRHARYGWFREQHYPVAAAVLICESVFRSNMQITREKITKFTLILVVLISLTSSLIIIRNPGVVRGTGFKISGEEYNQIKALGLASYPFFSSLPFLIPVLVYSIKNRLALTKKLPWWHLIALVVVIACSYLAVIVAPFLLAIIVLILAIMGRRRIKTNLAVMSIIAIIYIITPKALIGSFFYFAAEIVPNRDISYKLEEIGFGLTEGFELVTYADEARTGIEGRASRIKYNLQEFLKSPLIGLGRQSNAHIYWLNLLAQFGLIGVLPLIMIIRSQIKKHIRVMMPESLFTYYLAMGAFAFLGFMKAMGGYVMFIIPLFLVPALIYHEESWLLSRGR